MPGDADRTNGPSAAGRSAHDHAFGQDRRRPSAGTIMATRTRMVTTASKSSVSVALTIIVTTTTTTTAAGKGTTTTISRPPTSTC